MRRLMMQRQSSRRRHPFPNWAPTVSITSLMKSNTSKLAPSGNQSVIISAPDVVRALISLPPSVLCRALLEANPDKLLIVKVFAPWCRACKGLEPKFKALVKEETFQSLPMLWADLTIQHNKDYIKKIGVLALPTIQFYAHGQRLDTFPCGPSKLPILKRKLAQLVDDYIDVDTLQVKDKASVGAAAAAAQDGIDSVSATGTTDTTGSTSTTSTKPTFSSVNSYPTPDPATALDNDRIIQRVKSKVRTIPYFMGMLESEFETVLSKASLLTFDAGNIIMKEGNPGRTFYFIVQGEVEICQKTSFEDPLTTPPTYLGTVINRFEAGDYFGERALITGEPRAASIRASQQTQCLTFDRDDFPSDCVLSGQATYLWEASSSKEEDLSNMNERYGVALNDSMTALNDQQYQQAMQASQTRGSVNRPEIIDGVDNDRDVVSLEQAYLEGEIASAAGSYIDDATLAKQSPNKKLSIGADPEIIVPLLLRFKLIRLVTRCFDYIVENRLRLGDEASQKRRMILVNLLSVGQQAEIRDAFSLLDADGDGEITLNELARLMESIGDTRPEDELVDFIASTASSFRSFQQRDQQKQVITYRDFFGIMAEVEFYNLFLETFRALDHRNSGFVRAKDLDRVLCGIRDLVTGDRFSIIDVEDTDMMVDYEQFSKMLLGGSLS